MSEHIITTKLSPTSKENTETLVQFSMPEEDNTHPRVIEVDSYLRVQVNNLPPRVKAADIQPMVKLSNKDPSIPPKSSYNNNPSILPKSFVLIESNKIKPSSNSKNILKVIKPSYMTQPVPAVSHRYPTRATVAAAANTTQIEQM